MNLICTEPSQLEERGWQNFWTAAADPKDQTRVTNRKAMYKYGSLLGRDRNSMKTVAEVYNPERFGKQAEKVGLIKGAAFDLTLGYDLLKPEFQTEVLRYLNQVQPGLVIVSPPCTLFSLMQNMNNHRKTRRFLKRLRDARRLLKFAVKATLLVRAYGGSFVFEHPLTSRAWLEHEMQQLMDLDDVLLVATDQCYFGLKSVTGGFHKKPTGFLTNSPSIARELEHRCRGDHEHELILGSNCGGSRAQQAQEYPPRMVNAILRGYRQQLQGAEIQVITTDEVHRDWCQGQQRHQTIVEMMELYEPNEIYVGDEENDPENAMEDTADLPAPDSEPGGPQELIREGDLPPAVLPGHDADQRDDSERGGRLPRERPFSVAQLVRRAHEGLGHPGNDRLVRILKNAKASEEAVRLARNLKCSVCQQHAAVHPARRGAPPKQLHVNEIVGVDTVFLPFLEGKTRMALNIVDWSSRFQMIIPLRSHTPSEARRAYAQWIKFFGPPTRVYVDLGREFLGAFEMGAEHDATIFEPSALEMPTQRGITERAGKSYKEVLSKAMMHYTCQTEEDWNLLVDVANMMCNRLINKSGYSPVQRVLGFNPRIPGGLLTGGANDHSTRSLSGGDLQVQKANEMRLAAAKAFHEADCQQAIKNSIHAGHRKNIDFEVGQTVYFWRKGMEGAKRDRPGYWRGPARVVLTSPPSTVWVNFRGYVVKAAPEQLRLASEEEQFTLTKWIDDIANTRQELEQQPRQGYIDLTKEPFPLEDDPGEGEALPDQEHGRAPQYRLVGKRDHRQVIYKDDQLEDTWVMDERLGLVVRMHQQPRDWLFDPNEASAECPVEVERLTPVRRTYGKFVNTGREFNKTDNWQEHITMDVMTPWTGRTEFEISKTAEKHAATPHEEERDRKRSRIAEGEASEHPAGGLPVEENDEYEPDFIEDEIRHGEVRPREIVDEEMIENDETQENDEPDAKRLRIRFLDTYMTSVERMLQAKMKKEVQFQHIPKDQKQQFIEAIKKEVRNNLETNAYEVLDPTTSEEVRRTAGDKIVKSRFVLTEKNIEKDDIPAAKKAGVLLKEKGNESTKAKARHVMKGFSETNAEELETTTPQCARDTVLCTLQLICSMAWLPGYLDFTQAFHSGDEINREVYASQPSECPLPGYLPRQLLKLKKTCYGLLDGPYAWYQHLLRILTKQLGYRQSAGDPCLFYLTDDDDVSKLKGVISVATDDLLHGGDADHWTKMRWLNEHYKLGKFTQGDGRFVGKDIRCQKDGSFLVHQPMFAKKIQQIELSRERKQEKYSYCNEKEISQLRGLLGSLSWLAKETRPDLAGRVALLQQSMPNPYVQDLIEANSLAREAVQFADLGITIQPIPFEFLRVGTVSDASWGNTKPEKDETPSKDYWEEKERCWIRHHIQPRKLLFHPAGDPSGPNCYDLEPDRVTIADGQEYRDEWNQRNSCRTHSDESWCGQTIFFKSSATKKPKTKVNEKFLQQGRLASQGGFMTFFYDSRMETTERSYPISIINWKSFRIKRCTVNTLSAECQAMLQGVGALHWLRFLIREAQGQDLNIQNWEDEISHLPYIAVTDSKSLYDTIQKCCNTASHIEDKRTAIDVTILKRDFKQTKGQVRWVEGTRMVADSLTKKMGSSFLREVLTKGRWSLSELGFQQEGNSLLYLIPGL